MRSEVHNRIISNDQFEKLSKIADDIVYGFAEIVEAELGYSDSGGGLMELAAYLMTLVFQEQSVLQCVEPDDLEELIDTAATGLNGKGNYNYQNINPSQLNSDYMNQFLNGNIDFDPVRQKERRESFARPLFLALAGENIDNEIQEAIPTPPTQTPPGRP